MEFLPVIILVLSFVFFICIGTPVAWSIAISSLLTIIVSIPLLPAVTTIAQRMATALDSFALLAIPFFILSGQLMTQGGDCRSFNTLCQNYSRGTSRWISLN